MKKNVKFIVPLILLVFSLQGFMFYAKPTLVYESTAEKQQNNGILIQLDKFKDERTNKGSGAIGETCNAFFKTGDVKEPDNISEWVTDALKQELNAAGYSINDKPAQIVISGTIIEVSADFRMKTESSIILSVKVMQNNSVLLEELYNSACEEFQVGQFDISKGVSEILEKNLQQIMSKVMKDIEPIIKEVEGSGLDI